MDNFKYQLEKYQSRNSRHECPNCHDKHSFAYYIDSNGNIINKAVGRCNHESSCGYHYTPKEWFKDNPTDTYQPQRIDVRFKRVQMRIDPDFVSSYYVTKSTSLESSLAYYLRGLLPIDTVERVWSEYKIGATKDKSVIYWQIDINGNVRTGKIMKYDPDTGHRIKDCTGVNWIHSVLKKRGVLPDSFNLVQCLFGEHLLNKYPDKGVALVESEKTALIGSGLFPNYVWLATGGKSQLSFDKMKVLSGRRVIAFPDVDGFDYWKEKAVELLRRGIDISISDILESRATHDERERKIDIADWMLEQLETSSNPDSILSRLIKDYPPIGILVNALDLEVVV